jgi:hypothetical protein
MDLNGHSYRYAYIWVSDPRMYYIMTGFNPDGSDRFEEELNSESPDDSFDLESLSFDDVFKSESIVKKPSIRKSLPSILTIPGYEYTPEQIKKAEEDLKAEAFKNGKNVEEIVVPKNGYFETSRAWAGSPEKDKNPSILCADVPNWTTEEMLKEIFTKFSSDKSGIYPKINFRPKTRFNKEKNEIEQRKLASVEFSRSHLKDGIFTLQMTRKIILKDKSQELKNKEILRKDKSAVVVPVKNETIIWKFFRISDPEADEKKPKSSNFGNFDKFKSGGFRKDGFQNTRK